MSPLTSFKFFTVNYVPLIMMEWECYRPGFKELYKIDESQLQNFMSFFTSLNYTAHCAESRKQMTLEELSEYNGIDFVLMKNDTG